MSGYLLDTYDVWLLLLGLAAFGAVWLPRLVASRAVSFPLIYVTLGAIVFSLPLPIEAPNPGEQTVITERVTEAVVIFALLTAGLKIDRRFSWRGWGTTWRLLAITMPFTVAAAAWLGWWVLGLAPASAVLLGAVLAPTDPVMAGDVQAPAPGQGSVGGPEPDAELRFGLTSEAGLNDGLAFPFTNLAVALAVAGLAPSAWLSDWILFDVIYKTLVGTACGIGLGWVLARILFSSLSLGGLSQAMEGSIVIALLLLLYGVTEVLNGYGFLAVFLGAYVVRQSERSHQSHEVLHAFANNVEHLLMGALLLLFGGAVASGLLSALSWQAVAIASVIVFVVRPAAGVLGLLGQQTPWSARGPIAFLGIRGAGSLYYLAYGVNHASFPGVELLWATVAMAVLLSAIVHGISATPIIAWLERR